MKKAAAGGGSLACPELQVHVGAPAAAPSPSPRAVTSLLPPATTPASQAWCGRIFWGCSLLSCGPGGGRSGAAAQRCAHAHHKVGPRAAAPRAFPPAPAVSKSAFDGSASARVRHGLSAVTAPKGFGWHAGARQAMGAKRVKVAPHPPLPLNRPRRRRQQTQHASLCVAACVLRGLRGCACAVHGERVVGVLGGLDRITRVGWGA